MKTADALAKLPQKNREYLEGLRDNINRAKAVDNRNCIESFRAVARGYIRCLVDCGVIDDFKTIWIWFTL